MDATDHKVEGVCGEIRANGVLDPRLIVDLHAGPDRQDAGKPLMCPVDLAHVGVVVEVVHDGIGRIEVLVLREADLIQPDPHCLGALFEDGRAAVVRTIRVNLIVYCIEPVNHHALRSGRQ